MPYFITDSSPDCSGWATVKDDGEVIGCHTTKQAAIDQMVAISIAEELESGGERLKKKNKMKKTDYRVLPDNYRPSLSDDVPEGRACGNCVFYIESDVKEFADGELRAWCEKWDDYVNGAYYCNAWQPALEDRAEPNSLNVNDFVSWNSSGGRARGRIERIVNDGTINVPGSSFSITGTPDDPAALIRIYRPDGNGWDETDTLVGHKFSTLTKIDDLPENTLDEDDDEERQVNLTPPAYMRAAARRGLELNRQGFGGDGLTDKTKQEARDMAEGRVSEDKWRRIAPWIARHLVDLDAPKNNNPDDAGYPGAGLVAHLLWGSGPSKRSAQRTLDYAQSIIDRLDAEQNQSRWSSINVNLKNKEKENQVNKVERRVKTDVDFELRVEATESDGMRFTGYAAVFNSDSEPLPFIERIMPGAFKRSLKARNEVKLFKNHNMDEVLASTRSKTLRLSEDSKGLLAEATLPDTTAGRDLAVLMKRGDVHAMSFGFSVPNRGDSWSDDGMTRQLKEIRLHEVSIVTGFPAYEATTASVRSLDILATRTNVDVDALADALTKLESGEKLPNIQADLLQEVVTKLRENTPSSDELLEIKRKQLDLLLKVV
jgi:HK97 family phage prohead protease